MFLLAVLIACFIATVSGKIYFHEDFNSPDWKSRWTVPTQWKPKHELGEWKWTKGKFGQDEGIQTSQDARFYGISAPLDESFTNRDKDLVIQFSVKHEQDLDCGGAYIKLLGDIDQDKFGGDTPYQIMFGPDICGPSNKKTHVIFHYEPKNENLLALNQIRTETDNLSHLYTLHIKKDNTFAVYIDKNIVREGKLEDHWNFLQPKEIQDPNEVKPADWVDEEFIPDPTDIKPEGYDDIPKEIPDPDATQPEDWDTEEDGEWEAPLIRNPEYKGPWQPKMIKNPDYKGEWVHPLIPNPDYQEDETLYQRCKDCKYIGFELWQVKSGTIFDDILVTDSIEEANEIAEKTFYKKIEEEKKLHDKEVEELKAKAEEEGAKLNLGEDAVEEEHDEL